MAQGSITILDKFKLDLVNGIHDFDADTFKIFLSTAGLPAASTATAKSNFAEVTAGGTYTASGATTTITTSEPSAGTTRVDGTDVSWAQNASNPTTAKTALLFNETATNDPCVCYWDLTTDGGTTAIDMTTGDLNLTVNANGFFQLT